MDGYALRSADARAANASLVVVLQVAAGATPSRAIGPGEAARIFTGAPMPPGADAVIPQEDVRVEGDRIVAARPVRAGDFVRAAGEDVRGGDAGLERGPPDGPPEVGMPATLRYPPVRRHP